MPIFNWWHLHRTNDLHWIMVDHKVKLTKKSMKALYEMYEKLNDEFINEFGFTDEFKEYIEKKREIEILKLDLMISGDKTIETFIEIAELELKKLSSEFEGANFMDIKASLDKAMGFQIDPKKTSVHEYYSYIKFAKKSTEKVNG